MALADQHLGEADQRLQRVAGCVGVVVEHAIQMRYCA
jgi:hypothetical protein